MLIDAHAHLDRYGEHLKTALREIEERRIFTISTAMDIASYESGLRIADRSELVVATFGVHPRNAPAYASRLQELSRYIEQSPAIGEIGLDFHWIEDKTHYPAQKKVLEYFLAAAREQNKTVNLHTKGAEKEILKLLERYGIGRAIVHWYSGPLDLLRAFIDYGVYFTVGVEVLHSEHIRNIAREIPNALLLTETDNPGGLKWLSGSIGMPAALEDVTAALARLKSISTSAAASIVRENFLSLIGGDPWLAPFRARLLSL